jgi:hypothetical protein
MACIPVSLRPNHCCQPLQSGARASGELLGEEQLAQWLLQLQRLSSSSDGDTVHVLYKHLQRTQPWIRLGDVYSALVSLRDLGPELRAGEDTSLRAADSEPLPLPLLLPLPLPMTAEPKPQQSEAAAAATRHDPAGHSAPLNSYSAAEVPSAEHAPSRTPPSPAAAAGPGASTGPIGAASSAANTSGTASTCAPPSATSSASGNSTIASDGGARPAGILASHPSRATTASTPGSPSAAHLCKQPDAAAAGDHSDLAAEIDASPALLAYMSQRERAPHDDDDSAEEPPSAASDGDASDNSGHDQDAPAAAVPRALLEFKDQLLAARLKLGGGAWRLSAPAQQLLAALVRYRDALMPPAGSGSGRRGVRYMAGRCAAALALLVAEPQLGPGAAALVLEDLGLSAALLRLPGLQGSGAVS